MLEIFSALSILVMIIVSSATGDCFNLTINNFEPISFQVILCSNNVPMAKFAWRLRTVQIIFSWQVSEFSINWEYAVSEWMKWLNFEQNTVWEDELNESFQNLICCGDVETMIESKLSLTNSRLILHKTTTRPLTTPSTSTPSKVLTGGIKNHRNFKLINNPDICGITTKNRVKNGNEVAAINEFPWLVLLNYNSTEGESLRCGGTLISNRYVLTGKSLFSQSFLLSKSSPKR